MKVKSKQFFDFVNANLDKDPIKLALSLKKSDYDFNINDALVQIECRKKNKLKLKEFVTEPQFLFPDKISSEQSSHQAVAKFHSSLIPSGLKGLDLTAGLGIDAMTMAKENKTITAVELDTNKAQALQHNKAIFQLDNLSVISGDAIEFLNNTSERFDFIFIDPSRRDESNRRLYNLHHCNPDVINNQELLKKKTERIFIKASPLLDIHQTILDFNGVHSIRAIGVKGECKEILIEITTNQAAVSKILLEAINLDNNGDVLYRFSTSDNDTESIRYITEKDIIEGSYLLEPSSMIMKIAPWGAICNRFNAGKIDKSSHLFVSENLPQNFPGKVSRIEKVVNKTDRKSLKGLPATVVSKNYPVTSDELRKKLHLKEGDQTYIYATSISGSNILIKTGSLPKVQSDC